MNDFLLLLMTIALVAALAIMLSMIVPHVTYWITEQIIKGRKR